MESMDIVKKSLVRKQYTDANVLDYGKIPPQAKDLEQVILGAIMLERNAILEVADILSAECFYVDAHQRVWNAIISLNNEIKPIDILTVSERLKKTGDLDAVGGYYFIQQLTNGIGSSANIQEHARIIYEKFLQRQLISTSSEIIKDAYEDSTDAFELLARAQSMMDDINNSIVNGETFSDTVFNRVHELADAKANFKKTGAMTYLWKFDNHTGGFQNGEFIIIAGRPSMGKSAVMADFSYYQAKNEMPVGIFSLEMSKQQLIDRFLSIETEIEYEKMRTSSMTDYEASELSKQALQLAEYPISIHDEGGLGIGKLMSVAKMWKHKKGVKIIYIDYIQFISAHDVGIKFGNREQELSYISRKLKSLAKNLNIPIIALAQLSRAVEARGDKRPMLSDLRESGAIEQDADMVIFPFRPSYYQLNDANGQKYSDSYCELIIGKFRNGKTKDLQVDFLPQFSKFKREASEYKNLTPMRDITEPNKEDDPF